MRLSVLRFLVRKWANFFFLIDNLAFPIDSMHEDYNQEWIESFGQLSDKEEDALERYRVLKKSIWDKGGREPLDRFEASFYQTSESEPKGQHPEVTAVFEAFKERFQLMWKEYEPTLIQNQKLIEEEFSKVQTDFNQSFSAIGKLYGISSFRGQVEVCLMMRPDPGFRGGRMVSQKPPEIMVESGVSDSQNRDQINHLWLLLLHELTHACFENDKFFEFLDGYLAERSPLAHFLAEYPATKTPTLATRRAMREMIINSIEYSSYVRGKFEKGYAGSPKDGKAILGDIMEKKLLKRAKTDKEKTSIILRMGTLPYIAWKLEEVTKPYLKNGREIDKRFLDRVYEVLEEFPGNLLKDLKSVNKKKG